MQEGVQEVKRVWCGHGAVPLIDKRPIITIIVKIGISDTLVFTILVLSLWRSDPF